jgi:hypothetical protein
MMTLIDLGHMPGENNSTKVTNATAHNEGDWFAKLMPVKPFLKYRTLSLKRNNVGHNSRSASHSKPRRKFVYRLVVRRAK